jgi:non-ribosomal peptide synthetase component E (peptide arylation enzyme)
MGSVSYTALTPLSFLERSARVWPDKVAVIYGRRRLTYSEPVAAAVGQPSRRSAPRCRLARASA